MPFPTRPARADLRRDVAPWTSLAPAPVHQIDKDMTFENPWIDPSHVPPGLPCDERHWSWMESDPAISGAMAQRIATLVGGGVELAQGEGPGSEALFDHWSWVLGSLPLVSVAKLALRSTFRGWQIFEVRGAIRERDGKQLFVPVVLRNALTWQFRWTLGRDLVFQPSGIPVVGYRRQTLGGQMKFWAPAFNDLSNPYGYPLHGVYSRTNFSYLEQLHKGLVQIKRAQGFMEVSSGVPKFDAEGKVTAANVAQHAAFIQSLRDNITLLDSDSVVVNSTGVPFKWVELTAAVATWLDLFKWYTQGARSFYSGGDVLTQSAGASANRSTSETQERQSLNLGSCDAQEFIEDFRSGFLHPWSIPVAGILDPQAFPGVRVRPSLADVPMAAVPIVIFRSLNKTTPEMLELLASLKEIGMVENKDATEGEEGGDSLIRIDARKLFAGAKLPLVSEDFDGPIMDLSMRPQETFMPPPGVPRQFGMQNPAPGEELEEDAPEQVPGQRQPR